MRAVLALALVGCSHAAPTTRLDPVGPADDAFRQTVRRLAAADHELLTAWGTVRLGDGPIAYRFATLEPSDPAGRGLYVITSDDQHTWLARWRHDARTHAFAEHELGVGVTEPPWVFQPEIGVRHAQDGEPGTPTHATVIGLRGGLITAAPPIDEVQIVGPFTDDGSLIAAGAEPPRP